MSEHKEDLDATEEKLPYVAPQVESIQLSEEAAEALT